MTPGASTVQRKRLRLAPLWWACTLGLTLYVVYGCLIPAKDVPDFHVNDKVEHAGAYFALACCYVGVLQRRRFPVLIVALLLLGALIEVAQGLMGLGRTADVWDFAADAVGVALAVVPAYLGLDSWLLWVERLFGIS